MRKIRLYAVAALIFAAAFAALTVSVATVDVKTAANGGRIGLGTLNIAVYDFFGENPVWDMISDVLLAVAFLQAAAFFALFAAQAIKRKSPLKADGVLYLLLCAYAAVVLFYVLFELLPVNYRPLAGGENDSSFPSAHTLIGATVCGTGIPLILKYVKNARLGGFAVALSVAVTAINVAGRLFSGMHWLTDIVGGALLSAAITFSFAAACCKIRTSAEKKENE